ncbi:hypothetical protein [Rhodoplanes azumiensis]|uniref:Uncharacterized protein n=1 Tax=Rhodoplanes azumiensis TaxID=1897628 RepID=A0ABW5AF08_9BRAD
MAGRSLSIGVLPLTRGVSRARDHVCALTATWRRGLLSVLDPYRPEAHYMRGPGPKWHAKHGPQARR